MNNATIAIIGAGNMGSCIAGGLIANHFPKENIWMVDLHQEKLDHIKKHLGIHTTLHVEESANITDIIILAIKPNAIKKLANQLAPIVRLNKPLIISIAAGIRIASLEKWFGESLAIVRVMPNTPALVGSGASGLYANLQTSPDQKNLAESIIRAMGLIVWFENESDLDIVTALSGSGPAYFFLIIEILQECAEKLGLNSSAARLLSLQTAYGAARMALESNKSIQELRREVTSPGGTTEKAIKKLEEGNVRELFLNALTAAKKRAEELADENYSCHS